ncbi:MAG TPA: hypothetical protein VM938_09610 [Acidimicrobiales bacterium]|nr:hypothetical protein [Acidimicrobiales bacterium]
MDIIYPACDTDLFGRADALPLLWGLTSLRRHISLSTKAALSRGTVHGLADVSRVLGAAGRAMKVAVSITTKASVSRLERRASSYEERIETLRLLNEAGLPTALNLRPLLTDVAAAEYLEVLEECRPYTVRLLLGDEYVDPAAPRPQVGLEATDTFQISARPGWVAVMEPWLRRASVDQSGRVAAAAERLEYRVFHSDLDLMDDVIARLR